MLSIHPSIQSCIHSYIRFIPYHFIPYQSTQTFTKINLQQLFPIVFLFFHFRSPGSVLVWVPRFPWETAQSLDPSTNVRWKRRPIRSSIESCRSCQHPKFQCLGDLRFVGETQGPIPDSRKHLEIVDLEDGR